MTEVLMLYGIMLVSVTALASMFVSRHIAWSGFFVVGLLVIILGVSYASFETLLSRPKPIHLELLTTDEPVPLLHYTFEEGRAIYVLIQLETPRLYALPWSEETARQLQDAAEQAERNGTGVFMRLARRDPDTEEPQFWAVPQLSARPPKS